MNHQHHEAVASRSLRGLIAWISVCLLIAVWGPQLNPPIRKIWASVGSFGLASAVILEFAGRVHGAVRQRLQKRVTERRIARSLTRISVQNATLAEINAALRRIAEDDHRRGCLPSERRSQSSPAHHRVAQLRPTTGTMRADTTKLDESLPVYIRELSGCGVVFLHCRPITSRQVAIEFHLLDDQSITLVVDLQPQQDLPDGQFCSAGRIVGAIPGAARCRIHAAGAS